MEGALYGIMVPDSGAGAGVGGLTAASAGVPSRRPRYWCSYCCWHWLKVTLVYIGTYIYTLVDALSGGGWVAGWPGWCPKYATLAASPHHLCQLLSVTHSLPHQPTSSTSRRIYDKIYLTNCKLYFFELQTVFGLTANCICPNFKIYLSKFPFPICQQLFATPSHLRQEEQMAKKSSLQPDIDRNYCFAVLIDFG